jgi:hypothetical protein
VVEGNPSPSVERLEMRGIIGKLFSGMQRFYGVNDQKILIEALVRASTPPVARR